ncbi:MAG TPA: hypothetical protein VEW74_05370 [Candidatus Nitrosotalea sp.]|nr:hypothetical protein [Candidatus Nitrosotalea sp.]
MPCTSRAIAIIGMHRSGTSAVARSIAALGVYLGNDFLDAQPENPTGYWEDTGIVERDDRVLKTLGLRWDDVALIERRSFTGWRMWRLRRDLIRYLRRNFTAHALWGFKDPRSIRLLPFWERALHECDVDDAYLLAIRNPASVAASLFARQAMPVETAQRLWLVHIVPFLRDLAQKPLAVVDYDLLMQDPRTQLERIARKLELPRADAAEIDRFSGEFLDAKLRHTLFTLDDIDVTTQVGRLTRDAYALLHDVAADRREADDAFWLRWQELERSLHCAPSALRSG